jgi:hypothetical protein
MRRLVLLVTGALVVVAIATTASVTARRAPTHAASSEPPPWSGPADKEAEGPQSFLDLAASSGAPVTQAQVKRAAAQADALPDADSTRWQYVGPSNVAGG